MHPKIEELMEYIIVDGKVTDQEREVLLRKAKELGEDPDEVEVVLDAKLYELKQEETEQTDSAETGAPGSDEAGEAAGGTSGAGRFESGAAASKTAFGRSGRSGQRGGRKGNKDKPEQTPGKKILKGCLWAVGIYVAIVIVSFIVGWNFLFGSLSSATDGSSADTVVQDTETAGENDQAEKGLEVTSGKLGPSDPAEDNAGSGSPGKSGGTSGGGDDLVKLQKTSGEFSSTVRSKYGKRWAVIVGVDEYEDSSIVDLSYAGKDSQRLASILDSRGDFDNVYHLSSSGGAEFRPTRANMLRTLRYLSENAGEDDVVLFYFSGHGFSEGDENYLVPQDALLDDIKGTGISVDDLFEQLEASGAKFRLAFIDACREEVSEGTKSIKSRSFAESEYRLAEGSSALFSTKIGDYAYEDEDLGQGVFSYYISQGLLGDADENGDDMISYGEITDFVISGVNGWADRRMRSQKPFVTGEWSGDVLLTSTESGYTEETLAALPPKRVVEAYLSVWEWSERLDFVVNPATVRPEMAAHYANIELKGPQSLDGYEIALPEDVGWPAVDSDTTKIVLGWAQLIYEDGSRISGRLEGDEPFVVYVLRKREGRWKIDWPASLYPENPNPLSFIKAEQPSSPRRVLVYAKIDSFYHNQFKNSSNTHYCIELWYEESRLYGFIPKNSDDGRRLYELLRNHEKAKGMYYSGVPVTLELGYKPESRSHRYFDNICVDIYSFEHPYHFTSEEGEQ